MPSSLVSEQALARTYGPEAWTTVQQYREATRLRNTHPEMPRAEIARQIDRSPSAVRGWLAEGKTPPPAKAVATAAERGWLNLDSCSESFRVLNVLVAWIFSGGGISADRFEPRFSVDTMLGLATIDQLLSHLRVSYTVRVDTRSGAPGYEVMPTQAGTLLGRVLSVLGAPTGVKADAQALSLPSYLDDSTQPIRRDFARTYLFNRSVPTGDVEDARIGESRSRSYVSDVQSFLEAVLGVELTLGSQDRLWVPAQEIRSLAGGEPVRPRLATQIAHGTATPPSSRAFLSTYRRDRRPGGVRYVRAYRAAVETDASADGIATAFDLHPDTVENWRDDQAVPELVQALTLARERGWIGSDADPETARSLTALAAWLMARGTLRTASLHPVFRAPTAAHRDWFRTLTDRLGVSETVRFADDPNRTTELHIDAHGVVIGRLLHALGVPVAALDDGGVPSPRSYVDPDHAAAFVATWWLHHGSVSADALQLTTGYGTGEWLLKTLADLCETALGWSEVETTDSQVRIADPAARTQLADVLGADLIAQVADR